MLCMPWTLILISAYGLMSGISPWWYKYHICGWLGMRVSSNWHTQISEKYPFENFGNHLPCPHTGGWVCFLVFSLPLTYCLDLWKQIYAEVSVMSPWQRIQSKNWTEWTELKICVQCTEGVQVLKDPWQQENLLTWLLKFHSHYWLTRLAKATSF